MKKNMPAESPRHSGESASGGKKFQRKIENFTCKNCDAKVKGTGYTNHCPLCLWSKHVDINPGDRAEICGGMMEPIGLEKKKNDYTLLHKCQKCRIERKNQVADNDSIDALVNLSQTLAPYINF